MVLEAVPRTSSRRSSCLISASGSAENGYRWRLLEFVRTWVPTSRNVRFCTASKRLNLASPLFANVHIMDKLNTHANFHSNRQRPWPSLSRSNIWIEYILKVHTWLSRKWWHIGKTCLQPTHKTRMSIFDWLNLHLTLAQSKVQDHGRAYIACDYLANGKR